MKIRWCTTLLRLVLALPVLGFAASSSAGDDSLSHQGDLPLSEEWGEQGLIYYKVYRFNQVFTSSENKTLKSEELPYIACHRMELVKQIFHPSRNS